MPCLTRTGGRGTEIGRTECLLALSEESNVGGSCRPFVDHLRGMGQAIVETFFKMWKCTSMTGFPERICCHDSGRTDPLCMLFSKRVANCRELFTSKTVNYHHFQGNKGSGCPN